MSLVRSTASVSESSLGYVAAVKVIMFMVFMAAVTVITAKGVVP
jgi:hypothetical protein